MTSLTMKDSAIHSTLGRVTRARTRAGLTAALAFGAVIGCASGDSGDSEPSTAAVAATPTTSVAPTAAPPRGAPRFAPMQAIVKRKPGAAALSAAALHAVSSLEALPFELELARFDPNAPGIAADPEAATWDLIRELRARPDIEYAHPNWRFELSATPTEPLYANQWHYPLVNLPTAWDLTTGTPTTRIAVLDTGRTAHPDLTGKWVPGLEYDAANQDGDAQSDTSNTWRHGIHVAGIAGGAANNGGTAGVCWGCQILNVKVSRDNTFIDFDSVARGVRWAVANGAQVLNMSFESNGLACSHPDMTGIRDAIAFAISRNVSVVAAAGNKGANANVTVPASCTDVIAVAATDRSNNLAAYSNRTAVTLAAPGGAGTLVMGQNGLEIGPDGRGPGPTCPADANSFFGTSTNGAFAAWTTSNNGHCERYLSGTSMAAPHVAGVIGLMLSRNPNLSTVQIRQILQATAQPLPGCAGQCGAGLLNARGAVEQAAPLPVADALPVPRITASCSALTCTFSGSTSSDDRGVVAYQWTLPGQQRAAGVNTSFFMPGYTTHTVKLRVTDTSGQSQETSQLVTTSQPLIAPPPAGAYFNPQRSGAGLDLCYTSTGEITASWYTYETSGAPVWYTTGVAARQGARWSSQLYRSTWNGSATSTTSVGTIAIDFATATEGWLSWVLNGVPGGERYVFLGGGQGRAGAWYVPTQSGWGIQVQETGTTLVATVAFYHQTQPRWMQGTVASGSNVTIPLTSYQGPGLCPSCGGTTTATADPQWNLSSMNLQIANGSSTTGAASTDIKLFSTFIIPIWVRPLQTIQLLTAP